MNGIAGGDMSGGRDIVGIPRFVLEDSPKLKQKLQQFEDQQQKAKEAAAVLGDIDEIQGIKAQAKQAREEADTAMVNALEKSEAVVEEAQSQAQMIVDKATREVSRLTESAEASREHALVVEQEAIALREGADGMATRARESLQACDAKEQELQQRAEALDSRESELRGEKEKLASLSEHIRQTVG